VLAPVTRSTFGAAAEQVPSTLLLRALRDLATPCASRAALVGTDVSHNSIDVLIRVATNVRILGRLFAE
jgi:hypothetical protein